MSRIVENSKYLVLLGVFVALAAAAGALLLSLAKLYQLVLSLAGIFNGGKLSVIPLIELMDVLLIATALLVFAIGLYDLFIGEVKTPEWLRIHDLYSLKTKLGSVIILVMAITFLKNLEKWENAQDMFFFSLAIGAVAAVLIAFGRFHEHE